MTDERRETTRARIAAVSAALRDPAARPACPYCGAGRLAVEFLGPAGRPHEAKVSCTDCEAVSWARLGASNLAP